MRPPASTAIRFPPLRAVLCDVYGTLLSLHPPPADAAAQWQELWQRRFPRTPFVALEELAGRCLRRVERAHERARRSGTPHPEVDWRAVMAGALPGLAALTPSGRDDFILAHRRLTRRVSLRPGAAAFLSARVRDGIPLGLVSNGQTYTLRELESAFSGSELSLAWFDVGLNFWSFEHGFSKPDPAVFGSRARQAAARGLAPGEILVIGDRFDNDILPAQEAGFVTWWLAEEGDGDWFALARRCGDVAAV